MMTVTTENSIYHLTKVRHEPGLAPIVRAEKKVSTNGTQPVVRTGDVFVGYLVILQKGVALTILCQKEGRPWMFTSSHVVEMTGEL